MPSTFFFKFFQVIDKCKQEGTKDMRHYHIILDLRQEDATKRLIEVRSPENKDTHGPQSTQHTDHKK